MKAKGKKIVMVLGIVVCIVGLWMVYSQLTAKTPPILNEKGEKVEGSIAELIAINVNGHKEWLSIRGCDENAPVLLFLAGGPGGTQLAATRFELSELEKYFVVVNWEQPGSGKSYNCMKRSDITIDTYIEDGIFVTEYLRERFQKEQIYLVGESWGSALGVFLADKKPEYYAGVIGTGQMVDFEETEKIDYNKALELLRKKGDEKGVEKLEKQGTPLYYEGNIALLSANYLNVLSNEMARNPEIHNGGYQTFRDMFADEYGVVDSVHFMLGVMNTFNVVYPQLYDVDLIETYHSLEVPMYFFLGKHDINAPVELAVDYYEKLSCPHKELVWFEHSGHNPWMNESDKFVEETVRVFLK